MGFEGHSGRCRGRGGGGKGLVVARLGFFWEMRVRPRVERFFDSFCNMGCGSLAGET